MRGRKPDSARIKLLKGNPARRPVNLDEPVPEALDPTVPVELEDPVAREEWTRTIAPCIEIGQITAADRAPAIWHCVLWAVWRKQQISTEVPDSVQRMAHQTLTLMKQIDVELGLTPASRPRVRVARGAGKLAATNPLEKLLQASKG